jgi:hypothetical protein
MSLGAARVIWTINDLSMFVDEVAMGYTTMVLRTQRGPMGQATLVSNLNEYRRLFGLKTQANTDALVAEMSLRQGGRLNVIRTAHYADSNDPTTLEALASSVTLKDRGDQSTSGYAEGGAGPFVIAAPSAGSTIGTEEGPYTIVTDLNDKLVLQAGAGSPITVTLTAGAARTVQQIASDINGTASIEVDAGVSLGCLTLACDDVADDLIIGTVAHDAYSTLGLHVATYPANAGTDTFGVKVDGTTAQEITLTAGTSRTAAQVAVDINETIVGAVATVFDGHIRVTSRESGSSSSIQVDTATNTSVLGFDTDVHSGAPAGGLEDTIKIEAADPGVWGDSLLVTVTDTPLSHNQAFDLRISYGLQGELTEVYSGLVMDTTSSQYAVTYVNERSRIVTLTDMSSPSPEPTNRPAIQTNTPLTGGDDGLANFDDSDWIGSSSFGTGMYAADDAYMSMDLMIPGTTSVTVYQAMIAYVEARADMIAYGQTPFGLTPEETVDWRMGNDPWTHGAFNSHRFALFFGRPLVYDDLDDTRKYIPNLGHLSSCLCKTDQNYGYFYAPVGPRRGTVTLMEGIDFNIQGQRSTGYADLFAEYGINYLMICKQPGIQGSMFWEQRTTQIAPSALRELNVMRFITIINRMLMPILRTFLFEPNHPVTWREIHRTLQPAFDDWKAKYAIYDYALQTDKDAFFDGGLLKNAQINSGLDIDRGIYHCRALIQPTRTIYYLEFELGVMRTGQAFEEYKSMYVLPGWVKQ